ncbi:MAG: galactosyl transferase family [Pseudomonadota bacterium]|jgi:hypothetical protein
MKTAIVTLRFGERPYFDVSGPQLERYAKRHGYALHVADGSKLEDDGRDQRWAKVPAMLAALDAGADLVLYLDADCVLVDEAQPVTALLPELGDADLLVGRDSRHHANTGALLATPAARDILRAWNAVPDHHPETRTTWPVDELGFNAYVWPRPEFYFRIAAPPRVHGELADLVNGSFVRHCMNGTPEQKKTRMLVEMEARKR